MNPLEITTASEARDLMLEIFKDRDRAIDGLLIGRDGFLEARVMDGAQPANIGVIVGDEGIRDVVQHRFYTFLGTEHLGKVRELRHVKEYGGVEEFLKALPELEQQRFLFASLCVDDALLNDKLITSVLSYNSRVASQLGSIYPGVHIFPLSHIKEVASDVIRARDSAEYQRISPLQTLVVSNYRLLGTTAQALLGDIRKYGVSMFNVGYMTKGQVRSILTTEHGSSEREQLRTDVVMFNMVCQEKKLDDKDQLGLLQEIIVTNPHAYYILVINSEQDYQLVQGEFRGRWGYLQEILGERGTIALGRLPMDVEQLSPTDRRETTQYLDRIMATLGVPLNHYWKSKEGHKRFFLPLPDTSGNPITVSQARELERQLPGNATKSKPKVDFNVPLWNRSRMYMGGLGAAVVNARSFGDLASAASFCEHEGIMTDYKGRGSNIICGDMPGVLIDTNLMRGILGYSVEGEYTSLNHLSKELAIKELKKLHRRLGNGKEVLLELEAGYPLILLSNHLVEMGYSGLERYCRVPGAIGGAASMNAGVSRRNIDSIIHSVSLVRDGQKEVQLHDDLPWEYRFSGIQNQPHPVYSVTLKLTTAEPSEVRKLTDEFVTERAGEPKEASVGSFFKRRGYDVEGVGFYLDEVMDPLWTEGRTMSEGGVSIPAATGPKKKYASWIVAQNDRRYKGSWGTVYDIAKLTLALNQMLWGEAGSTHKELPFEARLLGTTLDGRPLQRIVEEAAAGRIPLDEVKEGLLIGGERYLRNREPLLKL